MTKGFLDSIRNKDVEYMTTVKKKYKLERSSEGRYMKKSKGRVTHKQDEY
jgi:hypothetical protein